MGQIDCGQAYNIYSQHETVADPIWLKGVFLHRLTVYGFRPYIKPSEFKSMFTFFLNFILKFKYFSPTHQLVPHSHQYAKYLFKSNFQGYFLVYHILLLMVVIYNSTH